MQILIQARLSLLRGGNDAERLKIAIVIVFSKNDGVKDVIFSKA